MGNKRKHHRSHRNLWQRFWHKRHRQTQTQPVFVIEIPDGLAKALKIIAPIMGATVLIGLAILMTLMAKN